jgi:hypothetical protein
MNYPFPMTPKFRLYCLLFHLLFAFRIGTTKSVGIHMLPVCHLRPTTALHADEQSDTHGLYC